MGLLNCYDRPSSAAADIAKPTSPYLSEINTMSFLSQDTLQDPGADLPVQFLDEDQYIRPFVEDWLRIYGNTVPNNWNETGKIDTATPTGPLAFTLDKGAESNGLPDPNSDSPTSSTLDHSFFSPGTDLDYGTPDVSRMKDFETTFEGSQKPRDAGGPLSVNLGPVVAVMDAKPLHYSPEASQTSTEPSDVARPKPTSPILDWFPEEPKVSMQATRSHRPVPCKYLGCDKIFSSASNRTRHERSSHGARKPCPQCGKLFKVRADYLSKHMEVCNRRIQKKIEAHWEH